MTLKVIVMFIDDLENGNRDVAGMKSKVKKLKSDLEARELAKEFAVDQNKEKGHEYFTVEFKTKTKWIKKVIKSINKSGAYNTRIYWYSN